MLDKAVTAWTIIHRVLLSDVKLTVLGSNVLALLTLAHNTDS